MKDGEGWEGSRNIRRRGSTYLETPGTCVGRSYAVNRDAKIRYRRLGRGLGTCRGSLKQEKGLLLPLAPGRSVRPTRAKDESPGTRSDLLVR